MNMNDDRTPEQQETHKWLVVGTDAFMSGWGSAEGGKSYAAWACKDEDRPAVLAWVEARGEMRRVREVYGDYSPTARGHCHIYVVTESHPSVARKYERARELAEFYGKTA